MTKDDPSGALRAYLERHFAGATIEIARLEEGEGCRGTVATSDGQYRLTVLDEAYSGPGAAGARERLEDFQVARVMREMAGFPITVTRNGCVFDDV